MHIASLTGLFPQLIFQCVTVGKAQVSLIKRWWPESHWAAMVSGSWCCACPLTGTLDRNRVIVTVINNTCPCPCRDKWSGAVSTQCWLSSSNSQHNSTQLSFSTGFISWTCVGVQGNRKVFFLCYISAASVVFSDGGGAATDEVTLWSEVHNVLMHTHQSDTDYCSLLFAVRRKSPFSSHVVILRFMLCFFRFSMRCGFQVKKLNSRIVNKKSALAPVLKSLRSLRQQCQVRINPIKTQNPLAV